MRLISAFLILLMPLSGFSQKKEISLEDIWSKNTFYASNIYGLSSMKGGKYYTSLEYNDMRKGSESAITKFEYKSGKKQSVILLSGDVIPDGSSAALTIDNYAFSEDEKKILIATETEKVYRHSTRENYYVWDINTRKLAKVAGGEKQMYGTFSPDGSKVAFVRGNNLFIKDLRSNTETSVTNDGKHNAIINGATDWVYEEEFSFDRAYFWSPDGRYMAYYKFDESRVKEFAMAEYNDSLYPTIYKFKYPKAGEANSVVSILIYDLQTGLTRPVDLGKETDQYIPRIKWTSDPAVLSVQRMNRLQNKLELMLCKAENGTSKVILTEDSKTFIEISDNLTFSKDNNYFIWSSDLDGFNHLYQYDMSGQLISQITKGNWDVLDYKGLDEARKTVYYTSDEPSVTETILCSIHLDGSAKKVLSTGKGTNTVEFSDGFNYYINTFTDLETPPYISLHSSDGKLIRVLEDNADLKKKLSEYNLSKKEFFSFKTSEGVELNGWMMKPVNFDPGKKYPVLMTFYGGPHNNEVSNEWGGGSYLWHSLLTQKGYIVACVDNRGTEGRGRDFKKCTYKQLGKLETLDQIEVAKYLGNQSYVDKTRIGVQGWSFGGYLSSLCMTKGADYFKAGIAVAPVTNWRFYDTIYTERYLSTPQENPAGYDENSPINFVDMLKGKYLLIHGSADDNVHLQNTMEMSRALIKANKQFEQFIYPDKNHGISGGTTRLNLFTRMTDFIVNNL